MVDKIANILESGSLQGELELARGLYTKVYPMTSYGIFVKVHLFIKHLNVLLIEAAT